MKTIVIFLFTYLLVFCTMSCSNSRILNDNYLEKDSLIIGYETTSDNSQILINRADTNSIFLVFLKQFDDTVILFHNETEKFRNYISNKSSVSNGDENKSFNLAFSKKKGDEYVKIVLVGEKKFIEFKIIKEYPLCSIQRYNKVWYINFRKYIMVLK